MGQGHSGSTDGPLVDIEGREEWGRQDIYNKVLLPEIFTMGIKSNVNGIHTFTEQVNFNGAEILWNKNLRH